MRGVTPRTRYMGGGGGGGVPTFSLDACYGLERVAPLFHCFFIVLSWVMSYQVCSFPRDDLEKTKQMDAELSAHRAVSSIC